MKKITLITAALICLFSVTIAKSAEIVTSAYKGNDNKEISILITIANPPPASLIIAQHLPEGVQIVKATPAYNKVNEKRGTVKWLLKDLKAGSMTIRFSFSEKVSSQDLVHEVRYRDPSTGKPVKITVRAPQ